MPNSNFSRGFGSKLTITAYGNTVERVDYGAWNDRTAGRRTKLAVPSSRGPQARPLIDDRSISEGSVKANFCPVLLELGTHLLACWGHQGRGNLCDGTSKSCDRLYILIT